MISNEPDFWFEVIPTNNLRDRARQMSTKSSKSTEIHEIIIVFDVKCHRNVVLCVGNQSLNFAKAKHMTTNTARDLELDLVMFGKNVLGAPF